MSLRRAVLALICAIIIVIMLAGCSKSETPLTYSESVSSTDLSAEKGGEIRLGMSEQELVRGLGKPIRTLNDGGRSFIFMYEAYQYTSIANEIVGYSLSPTSQTAKGIKLGDSRAEVVKQYGANFYTRSDKGSSATLGYIDHSNRLALEFEMKDDHVRAINLTTLKMYE